MKLYCDIDREIGPVSLAYYFTKKRFIKACNALSISDWKQFLKQEYTSDDTEEIADYFDKHNWNYKVQTL